MPALLSNKMLARVGRSQFFMYSLLIHAALVVLLGSAVLFQAVMQEEEFFGEPGSGGFFAEMAEPQPQPQIPQQTLQTPTVQAAVPTVTQQASLTAITAVGPSVANFSVPTFQTAVTAPTQSLQAAAPQRVSASAVAGMTTAQARAIKSFTSGWGVGGQGTGGLRQRKFKFTAYLAKYAMGDWNATVSMSGSRIVKGSLPNLLFFMKKFSADRIDANPNPEPLNLASSEIFTVKPPFIFFNGRRDFKLSDQEVENLRKYVLSGGAIWGDSSLPGRRSRFDIAFRREMRRVLPDRDKDFEALPADHPIYRGGYFQNIQAAPSGLNYYQEPVEVLRIFGEIAVIYTMNAYGVMWQVGIDEKGQPDLRRTESGPMVATDENIWDRREFYFRNLSPEALLASYQFGTNVVTHLLVRWENPLRRVPTGL